jgi:Nif-specific regulatory protein
MIFQQPREVNKLNHNFLPDDIYRLELKVLYEICGIIEQILSLDQALESILAILSNSLSMERATVTLKDDGSGLLKIRASHDLGPEEKKRGIYKPDEGVTGHIFRSAQPFIVPDVGQEPLFLNKTQARNLKKESISFIGVPITLKGETIGVLSVDRLFDTDVTFEEDIRFLTIVAALIAQFVQLNYEVYHREKDLVNENRSLRAELSEKYNHFFTVGVSPAMSALNRMIQKVAPSKASVLLLGESGTGKTLTARIIHEMSDRARCPFVKVNCAALPDNLIESELFGYEKGAFSGASQTKTGQLEEADTGTVFLDEIGEMPLGVQAKLLHFLQEKELVRLGSTKTRKVDARIIAATNSDLSVAVDNGTFRPDLYYRLNVFPIAIPPLRERKADIPFLVSYFLGKNTKEYGRKLNLSEECIALFTAHNWPGNVRELENTLERLAILSDNDCIGKGDLPSDLFIKKEKPHAMAEIPTGLVQMEQELVIAALYRNGWIQQLAARDLGLSQRQMSYRVKKFKLDRIIREGKRKKHQGIA